jgi:succinate dehydrogenase / fumarate reductase membrane anchor subunit
MSNGNNIGRKRLVVGAHYGLKDWLMQRVTAVVMAVYTMILLSLFLGSNRFNYESWTRIFSLQWFKISTFLTFIALFLHAWVGVRDIWMDYIKPTSIRLTLQIFTILWVISCAVWTAQILWRV